MKKKLFPAVCFSLALAAPTITAASLIPQSILKNHHQSKNLIKKATLVNQEDEYVDFSGHWVGSCDNFPNEQNELDIKLSPNFSLINIDGNSYPIDAISTQGSHTNDEHNNQMVHMYWSPDGQRLLINIAAFFKEGSLNEGGSLEVVANDEILINNKQLIYNQEYTIFENGVYGVTTKRRCVYENQNKK